jgi:hemolysin III
MSITAPPHPRTNDGLSLPDKPTMRGVLHQWAALAAAAAGAVLVGMAPGARAAWAAGGFVVSLVVLFGVSATYHRVTWRPRARAWMRRLDHASIFVLIAGTYTPIAVLGLPAGAGNVLLAAVWGGAAVGIAVSLLWVRAPKVVSAALCLAVGWTVVPFLGEVVAALDAGALGLIVGGGVAYTAGAVAYASGRPRLAPRVFGYHELFHACTVVAAGLHFAAVLLIVRGPAG